MLKEVHFIATPIGNIGDMTMRSVEALKETKLIFIEELKVARRLFRNLKIEQDDKNFIEINEHNEKKEAKQILEQTMLKYDTACLITDCGYPAIADSGYAFLEECIALGIKINYYPGASSILGALLVSGFPTTDFYYCGFLPRNEKQRKQSLLRIKNFKTTLIIMETPYRLQVLLQSLKKVFHKNKNIALCFNLTCHDETIFRGTIADAQDRFGEKKNTRNFVLVINNNGVGGY